MFLLSKSYSRSVHNDRTLLSVVNHAEEEIEELKVELLRDHFGFDAGEDGVVGEAIDVIACMLDVIHMHEPALTEKEFYTIFEKKLYKWKEKYHVPQEL